jgi:hypothetical protein
MLQGQLLVLGVVPQAGEKGLKEESNSNRKQFMLRIPIYRINRNVSALKMNSKWQPMYISLQTLKLLHN